MAAINQSNSIYSATYSGVPVYEFNTGGHHVMRRRHDGWVNATQILKVAEYDKPSRTRILEKEVHKSAHEKVQGGYGKYQGTWVSMQTGRDLAERNSVLHKLRPLFDYIPGDVSPPPAPKHTTAASNKPKIPKPAATKRGPIQNFNQMNVGHHDNISSQLNDDESYDNSTIASESFLEEEEMYHRLPQAGGSHKRKRAADSKIDNDHQLYADSLLDYFIICGGDTPASELSPPSLPAGFQIDRAIDNHNHTALHWAAAMADLEMVKYFLSLGANKRVRNVRGETPIIRAVIFTNNYEKNTMEKMVSLFQTTLQDRDDYGGTVFHHAAALTFSHVKRQGARHYLDILLNMFSEIVSQQEFFHFLNAQDHNGDTALHIVARNNAKKCVRALQGRGVASDISNKNEETVDQILYRSRGHRNQRYDLASSSPVQPEPIPVNGNELSRTSKPIALFPTSSHYETQSAQSFSESFATILPDKGLQVALALESGVHDKEADLAEANRLLRNNIAERDQVRQETLIITQQGFSDYSDVEDDRDSTDEELKLQALNEGLLEQLQHKSLHHEVRAQEQTLPPSIHQPRTQGSLEDRFDDEVVERRLRAAQNLAESQRNRRADAARVVQALSTAGMSERGESYKRLIGSTMGLSPEEVSTMAPELLDVLEMSKLDTTAAQTGDGILVS